MSGHVTGPIDRDSAHVRGLSPSQSIMFQSFATLDRGLQQPWATRPLPTERRAFEGCIEENIAYRLFEFLCGTQVTYWNPDSQRLKDATS